MLTDSPRLKRASRSHAKTGFTPGLQNDEKPLRFQGFSLVRALNDSPEALSARLGVLWIVSEAIWGAF